jgi:hypothetical protein
MMVSIVQKLMIAAIGAVCLSLLKLISAGFYLGASTPQAALGAYLTYLAYVLLGMAVGAFFCEDSNVPEKTRKSAFLMGLLAPSILLAIISQPPNSGVLAGTDAGKIPTISMRIMDGLFPIAHAQTTTPASAKQVEILSKDESTAGFWDGVKNALGLAPGKQDQSLWVVGKTDDVGAAEKTAGDLDQWLKKFPSANLQDLKSKIVKPEGSNTFYVTVGGMVAPAQATAIDKSIRKSAAETLGNQSTAQDKSAASTAIKGNIINSSALFVK